MNRLFHRGVLFLIMVFVTILGCAAPGPDLVGAGGRVLERRVVAYVPVTAMSRYAEFNVTMKSAPVRESAIRVTHDGLEKGEE